MSKIKLGDIFLFRSLDYLFAEDLPEDRFDEGQEKEQYLKVVNIDKLEIYTKVLIGEEAGLSWILKKDELLTWGRKLEGEELAAFKVLYGK